MAGLTPFGSIASRVVSNLPKPQTPAAKAQAAAESARAGDEAIECLQAIRDNARRAAVLLRKSDLHYRMCLVEDCEVLATSMGSKIIETLEER